MKVWYTVRLDADNPETALGNYLDGPEVFDSMEAARKRIDGLTVSFERIAIFRHTELPTVSDYSRGERI